MNKVHVVGAGGVGFWLAASLAREGVEFTLYDADTLTGGLGYTRLPKASSSTYKVDLLKGFCVAVLGCKAPEVVKGSFIGDEAESGDLVIDCTDMELSKRQVMWRIVKLAGARIIRVSYDGRNDTVVVCEGLPLSSKPGGGYQEIPSMALSFVAGGIGTLVVKRILAGFTEHTEFQVSISDYFSPDNDFLKAVEASGDLENTTSITRLLAVQREEDQVNRFRGE